MSLLIRCLLCDEPLPVSRSQAGQQITCPKCQAAIDVPAFEDTPAAGAAAWWLGDQKPSAAPAPGPAFGNATHTVLEPAHGPARPPAPELPKTEVHRDPVPHSARPARPISADPLGAAEPAPAPAEWSLWGLLALLLGLGAFGLAWVPHLGYLSLSLGGLGLLLGLAGSLIAGITRGTPAFPLASSAICAQALVLAGIFTLFGLPRQPESFSGDDGSPPPGPQPGSAANPPPPIIQDLLRALKSPKPEPRLTALQTLAALAGGLGDSVPALTDQLLDKENPRNQVAASTVLGKLGPQARGAFPLLLHVSKLDESPATRQAAAAALERIGRPAVSDRKSLVQGLKAPSADYRAAVAQTLTWVASPATPDLVPELLEALKDPDVRVRLWVARALWTINRQPQEVLPVFREALHNVKDAGVRSAAAETLGLMGPEARPAIDDLKLVLHDEDVSVRLYAAQALWVMDRQHTAAVIPVFTKALNARDTSHRATAAYMLGRIGPQARQAVGPLIEALKSDDADLKERAAFALGAIGPDSAAAVPLLIALARQGDVHLREQAVNALRGIGPAAKEAVPLLIELLKADNLTLRGRAVLALASIGPDARAAVPALAEAIRDNKDPSMQLFLAQAVWLVEGNVQQALPALCDLALDDSLDSKVRKEAIQVLGRMGPTARVAYTVLAQLKEQADEELLLAIEPALARMGPPTRQDVPNLMAALSAATSLRYRIAVVQTLWLLGPEAKEAVPALLTVFKGSREVPLRVAIAEAFEAMREEAREAVPALIDALAEKGQELKVAALEALAAMGPESKEALPVLRDLLQDKAAGVRAAAALCVGAIGKEARPALAQLGELVKDEDAAVRLYAAQALWVVDQQSRVAIPVLLDCLNSKDAQVRATAAAALGMMAGTAKEALPKLTALLRDSDESVRKSAAAAIKKIDPSRDPMPK